MPEHPPIAGYELLKECGRNGHILYVARQSSTGRLVHLHVVHSAGNFGRMAADTLREQAALLNSLDHPNILQAIETGGADGPVFFSALEYASGGSLAEKIRSGPFRPTEAATLAQSVASALQYARRQSVAADNLEPGSVFLTEEGLAKLASFRHLRSNSSALPGTLFAPGYASPEEVQNFEDTELSAAVDVYRIGGLLYAMLTGQPPFRGGRDLRETIHQIITQSPLPVRHFNAAVPASLEAICTMCLEKAPTSRYSDAGVLLNALDHWMAGVST